MPLLSVIVPVYNEIKTIGQILVKIDSVPIDKEIVVVDNCSTDGTREILQDILKKRQFKEIRVIYRSYNQGKGESVKDGIRQARGEFVIIQDADLEYDPNGYLDLLKPLLEDKAELVLGARFTAGYRGLRLHKLGNRFLTAFLNAMFGAQLNDYATCYKMARQKTFLDLKLKSQSFDIEAEIVCKALKKHLRLKEIPIVYYPRAYSEGKKIRWKDGLQAIISILKYRFSK